MDSYNKQRNTEELKQFQEWFESPGVKLLLVNHSDAVVQMVYRPAKWPMPKIGPRPPYYTDPIYEAEYPVI